MNSFFASKLNQALAAAALAGLVLALASYAYVTLKNSEGWTGPTTITIIGNGEVQAIPDIATFSFSVRGEGPTASEAQATSAKAVNDIMGYLKEQGVEEKDVKTTNYNLMPRYTYEQRPCIMGMMCPPSEPKQDGFEVSQTVTVKVRNTDTAGALLTGVGERGATDISSLGFTIDDEESLKAEARKLAIEDAKVQAKALADQLGVTIGEMTGYYEESGTPYPFGMGGDMMMNAKAEMAPSPEIPMGENTITSRVNLTYTIK